MNVPWRQWRLWQVDAAGAAVCVAFVLVFYLGGVRPLVLRYRNCSALEGQLKTERSQAERLERELDSLQGRHDRVRDALAKLPLRLEPSSAVNRRLAQVSDLAAESSLKIDNIQPGQPVPGTHHETVAIYLAGSGTYPMCTLFLHRLRKAFPDVAVRSMELTGDPADALGTGRFRLDLCWYAAPAASANGQVR